MVAAMATTRRALSLAAAAVALLSIGGYVGFYLGTRTAVDTFRSISFGSHESELRRKVELLGLLRRNEVAGAIRRLELMAAIDYSILSEDAESNGSIGQSHALVEKYCRARGKRPAAPQMGAPLCAKS